MFHRALSQSLDQYVWKVVFGRFNSFFQKSFNIWEMFVVKCYIYIGFWASKLTKKLFRLYYMHLLSNLIVHLLCIWLHSLFPNSINENYEVHFHTQRPFAHNDVTKLLCLLHYYLFMLLCCFFCYPNLSTMFAPMVCYLDFL